MILRSVRITEIQFFFTVHKTKSQGKNNSFDMDGVQCKVS